MPTPLATLGELRFIVCMEEGEPGSEGTVFRPC